MQHDKGSVGLLRSKILENPTNTELIQRATLDFLEDVQDVDIVDCGNPAIFGMESSAVHAAAAMEHNVSTLSKIYPVLASSYEDLYMHMADADYDRRFALPSSGRLTIVIEYNSFLNSIVEDDNGLSHSVEMPKDTTITVGNYVYTLVDAVNIALYKDTVNVSIHRDDDTDGLVKTQLLGSNVIKDTQGVKHIIFTLNIPQLKKAVGHFDITPSLVFNETVEFDDQFSSIKVYYRNISGEWTRLSVSHSTDVLDPYKPTAILRVGDGNVTINIPPIYTSNNAIGTEILAIVYSTLGAINYDPRDLSSESNSSKLLDLTDDFTPQHTGMSNTSYRVYAGDVLQGGRDGLTFDELRDRMLHNTVGMNHLPITPTHMVDIATDYGFESILHENTLTGRLWTVSNDTPVSTDTPYYGTIPSSYLRLNTSVQQLYNLEANEERIRGDIDRIGSISTLDVFIPIIIFTPNDLFRVDQGIVEIDTRESLDGKQKDVLVGLLNNSEYRYTPFYHVLDKISDGKEPYKVRSYHLSDPKALYIDSIDRNATTPLVMNTDKINIELVEQNYFDSSGVFRPVGTRTSRVGRPEKVYNIYLQTTPDPSTKDIPEDNLTARIIWKNAHNDHIVYLDTVEVYKNEDGTAVFRFTMLTNIYIYGDGVNVVGVKNDNKVGALNSLPFDLDLHILYGVKDISTVEGHSSSYKPWSADINSGNQNNGAFYINHEIAKCHIGTYLSNLWNDIRQNDTTEVYETYDEDVPLRHNVTTLTLDPNRPPPFEIVNNCDVEFKETNKAGDVVTDDDNNIIYLHRAGDTIYRNGEPIVKSIDSTLFTLDMFTFDAKFMFAEDQAILDHIRQVTDYIVEQSTNAIQPLIDRSLEHTKINYRPYDSMGLARIDSIPGEQTWVNKQQDLKVNIFATRRVTDSNSSRGLLKSTTINTINESMSSNVVSHSNMVSTLQSAYGTGVSGVSVTGFSGLSNDNLTVTLVKNTDRMAIGMEAFVNEQSQISIKDRIEISFIGQ